MTGDEHGRRRFLYRAGSVAALGALAGCLGENPGSDGSGGGTTTGTATSATSTAATSTTTAATTTESETATETGTDTEDTAGTENASTTASTSSSSYLQPAPTTVDQWLLDQNPFYDGNMVVGVPFVGVGAGENDTGFDPAAIKISTGTEVTWEWASGDKPHNVVQIAQVGTEEAMFDSGEPEQGNNITFRYTFDQAGIYRYVCTAHREQTGRGAVVVVDEPVGIGGDANGSA